MNVTPPQNAASATTSPGPLPAVLYRAFANGSAFADTGQSVPLHSQVSVAEAEQLYRVVRELRPEHSLEIGFAQGISALAILQGVQQNPRARHHVIDPFQHRFQNVGLAMVERAGLTPWLDFHPRFPEEVIPLLPPVQFVFIDSSHLFDLTLTEFVLADKRLSPGGVIALHDLWMPSMQAVARYILTNRAYERLGASRPPAATRSWRQKTRAWRGAFLNAFEGCNLIFRSEWLQPDAFAEGNLLFLQKKSHDDRDWRFHEPF